MVRQNRVLAIDDNAINLAMIEEGLKDGFVLRLVDDSEQALAVAARFLPDVVLLDAMMPTVDGFEICTRLRHHPILRHTQIIMVSAKSALNDRLLGYHVGADDYLTKPFDEAELLAKVIAAVRNKREHDKALSQLDASQTATFDVLRGLMVARKIDSKGHTDRLRIYCLLLASELHRGPLNGKITELFVEGLYLACALHDVGKLALPDLILKERDPHTGSELPRLRKHVQLGEQILRTLVLSNETGSPVKVAAEVARSHHEQFDGSGYPDGLKADDIPLAARIISVAAAYDSLTSGFLGATRLSPIAARDAIQLDRGRKYDPMVVDAFVNVYEEFISVCESEDFAENRDSVQMCAT